MNGLVSQLIAETIALRPILFVDQHNDIFSLNTYLRNLDSRLELDSADSEVRNLRAIAFLGNSKNHF